MNATPSAPPVRHALVTGAGRGIGAAIVRRLVADGIRVSLLGRTASALADVAGDCDPAMIVATLVCDITDGQAVSDAIARAQTAGGAVQILVNNAGQAQSAPLVRTSDALWHDMLSVNLTGTFLCMRALLPAMQQSGWGRIINIASTAGQRGYAYVGAYVAAKHGVVGLTRAAALEMAAHGITVNAVCPGFTDTDLLHRSIDTIVAKTGRTAEAARAELAQLNPQGRLVQTREVASAVAWLCSDDASAINGQSISVSGGEVM